MKRMLNFLLSLILALTCISPVCVFADEKTAVKADEQAEEKAAVLSELGIISGYTADSDVTKSLIDDVITRVTGTKAETIKFLNETYRDSQLTAAQTAAVMLDILGYTNYTKATGGAYNASSVYRMANRVGILKGVSAGRGDYLKTADFVKMLYNTLFEADMMDAVNWGDTVKYEIKENKTAAYTYMNIVTVEGVVFASGKLNMTTKNELEPEEVILGNTEYTYKQLPDPDTVIGRYARGFVKEKDDRKLLALEIIADKNSVLELESDDIDLGGITERTIPYYDSRDKKQKAQLSATVNVVYNGELVPFYNRDDLDVEDAYYSLIDSNDDKVYDTVVISRYTPVLVWHASNGKVSYTLVDYNNNTYNFDDFFDDGYPFIEDDGKAASWRDVGQYDVLSLRQSKSGVYNKIIHNIKKVNGIYTTSREDMKYITIDGVEYKTTKEFKTNSLMHSKLSVGDKVSAFFDCFGRVVGAIPSEETDEYAAIIAIGSRGAFGSYPIKYLSKTGKVVSTTVESEFKLNGKKVPADTVMSGSIFFKADGSIKPQLVRISTGKNGEVKEITTADESKAGTGVVGCEGLTLTEDFSETEMNLSTINGSAVGNSRYYFDTDTVCFTVCTDDDERCSVGTGSPGEHYKGMLYNADSDYHIGFAVLYQKRQDLDRAWVNVNNTAYLVESTGTVMHPHKEGEIAYAIYAWSRNDDGSIDRKTLICEDPGYTMNTNYYNCMAWVYGNNRGTSGGTLRDALKKEVEDVWAVTKWSEIPEGSVITVNQDNGIVTNFVIQYLGGSNCKFEAMEDNTQTDSLMIGRWGYGVTKTMFMANTLYSLGTVQQVNRYGIVVNNHLPSDAEGGEGAFPVSAWNRTVPLGSDTKVYMYDKNEKNTIQLGSAMDIKTGDRIFMRHLEGNADMIIVYK